MWTTISWDARRRFADGFDVTSNWIVSRDMKTEMTMKIKKGEIAVWVSRLLAVMFLFAGTTKLLGSERDIGHFAAWGYPDWFRYVIGSAEVVSAILLLIRRVSYFGAVGISITLLWAGYTFLVRVPEEAWRALPTLIILVIVGVVGYASRPKHAQ